jgi:hypothetical protein
MAVVLQLWGATAKGGAMGLEGGRSIKMKKKQIFSLI